MKKHLYKFGTLALALSMSGLPAAALAENNRGAVNVDAQAQVQGTDATANVAAQSGESEGEKGNEGQGNQSEVTGSNDQSGNEKVPGEVKETQEPQEIDLELEDDSNPATSFEDLKQKIEMRKQQLEKELASSSPQNQIIVANANPVRLAVHALLASKDLVGGIGQQVSEIAKEVDHSVASTTNAEAQIQSRGFFARLFFGGDSTAADVIAKAATDNQTRIDDLTTLLGQVNISADVQATLTAQITALKDAQARLQELADREQKAWGLFSWRF